MAGLISGALRGWQLYLAAGVAAVALLGASYSAGYLIAQKHDALAQVSSVQAKAASEVKAINVQDQHNQADRVQRTVRDMGRERELQSQIDGLQANNANLKNILNAKPDPDAGVHVRIGDVRMLNSAIDIGVGPQGIPNSPSVAAYQEQAASTVSLRDLVTDDLDIRTQYKELAAEHDKLIDWVQVELIDAQVNASKTESQK